VELEIRLVDEHQAMDGYFLRRILVAAAWRDGLSPRELNPSRTRMWTDSREISREYAGSQKAIV
jgi:hypothetical protein